MYKKILAGTTLALLLAGPALAQDPEGKGGTAGVAAPGEPPVAPPSQEKTAAEEKAPAQQPVEYAFGVSGLFRGEGAGNFDLVNLNYRPQHAEGLFLYRLRPYALWNPADELGLRLEGQWYGYTGGGHHRQEFSLYQGYLDLKLPPQGILSLRAGRQELLYGSAFMLGADAFYNGLSYDALRLRVTPAASLTLDFFGGYYTYPWSDGVKGDLAGLYSSWTVSDGNALEGYLLRDTGSQHHHPGEETDSIGLRGTLKAGALSLELEPVCQFGDTFSVLGRNDDISAYGGHVDLNAEFSAGSLKQKLWLGYALGSGSRAAAQGESSRLEFNNQDNDTAITGDMHVVNALSGATVNGHHASGLDIYTLGWSADLTKELNLSATGHYFRADAVANGFSRELGLETDFILTYTISENYSLLLAYERFFTGGFFRDASGSGADIHYGYAMLQFNLEKSRPKGLKREKGA